MKNKSRFFDLFFLENNIINYFSTIHILEILQWQGVQSS